MRSRLQAHELAEQGLPYSEIAERLEIRRNRLTAVMAHWYESRGLEVPDGRSRRRQLGHKKPQFIEQLIPSALKLYDAGSRMKEIAEQLHVDRHTAAKAIREGLAQRGEKYVDGRTRSGSFGFNRKDRRDIPRERSADGEKPQDDEENQHDDAA